MAEVTVAPFSLPETVVECDGGCGKPLNLLTPHLSLAIRAKRMVLLSEDVPSDDPNEVPDVEIRLGSKDGRGRLLRLHNFTCLSKYANADKRKGKDARLEYHAEDEIYEPEDNRSPEELVADGELPKSYLRFHNEVSENRGDEE